VRTVLAIIRTSWCSGLGTLTELFLKEVFEEDLHGGSVGAQASDVQLEHTGKEQIPCVPCYVVSAVEGVPAVVGSHSSQCDDSVSHGKDTEQGHFLSNGYLKVPVEECGKNGSQRILGA